MQCECGHATDGHKGNGDCFAYDCPCQVARPSVSYLDVLDILHGLTEDHYADHVVRVP